MISGCAKIPVRDLFASCPRTPDEQSDVTWIPDVAHPVGSAFVDVPAADDHRAMRIYYPAAVAGRLPVATGAARFVADGPPPPILRVCLTRWPIVVFLHGGFGFDPGSTTRHQRFRRIGATLAKSGYVAVFPSHAGSNAFSNADVDALRRDLAFVRTGWDRSHAVSQSANFMLAGHSNGALQSFHLARRMPEVAALAALSGEFNYYPDLTAFYSDLRIPKLFMWARGLRAEDLAGFRGAFKGPTWTVDFEGQHFDYLNTADTGNALRGPCTHIGALAADLTALFAAANFVSRTPVPLDLSPPQVSLSTVQSSYAGDHLQHQAQVRTSTGCGMFIRWSVEGETGCRYVGSFPPAPCPTAP